jgi:diguanylate cyclase
MALWQLSELRDFSRRGRGRVFLVTVLGTAATLAVALITVSYTTQFMPPPPRDVTFASAWIVSLLLAIPTFYIFANALRKAAIAQHQLALLASQDSLTTCLNHGAFVTLVDAYLSQLKAEQMRGGLLMVDADRFKSINDRYGHLSGDRALRLIANTIMDNVRSVDLVGRVGGEEFAVFLPGADQGHIETVAERIRSAVRNIEFAPAEIRETLSVSIGGAVFQRTVSFETLFAAADAQLYNAKKQGRNRVLMHAIQAAA